MRIFVAYGYNSRDDWIPTLVFPIIEAFGAEVVTGEKLWGDSIPPRVQERIRQADALVGFATRRAAALPDGTYTTHRWVTDEIAFALALGRPIVEVVEAGVSDQGGIVGTARARRSRAEASPSPNGSLSKRELRIYGGVVSDRPLPMDAMSPAERADFERRLQCIAHTCRCHYLRNQPEPRASLELRPTW